MTTTRPIRSSRDLGLLAIRLMLAVVFLFHGSQKLFGAFGGYGLSGTAGWLGSQGVPLPLVAATAAALAEFVGGLSLLTGLGFRFAMPVLGFNMLVAAYVGHAGKGFDIQQGGAEYALTLAVVALALFATGPGRYAVSTSTSPAAEEALAR